MRKVVFGALFIIPLLAVAWLALEGGKAPLSSKKNAEKKATVVEVVTVQPGTAVYDAVTSGTLKSNEAAVIAPEVDGRVLEINFTEGARVKKGDVLVKLDSSLEEAELASAKASFNNSRLAFQRADKLAKGGVATVETRDNALAKMRVDEAAVALAQAKVDKMIIRAPFNGLVGIRGVSPGSMVKTGERIALIEDVSRLKADFSLPQSYYSKITKGMEIELGSDAVPGRSFKGAIQAVDPGVDESSRNISARAVVDNPDGILKPGLFVNIRIILGEDANALLVPEQAVFPEASKTYVYIVRDGKAVRAEVLTGIRHGGNVEITQGLNAGEVVITDGHIKIRDGSLVAIAEDKKPEIGVQ